MGKKKVEVELFKLYKINLRLKKHLRILSWTLLSSNWPAMMIHCYYLCFLSLWVSRSLIIPFLPWPAMYRLHSFVSFHLRFSSIWECFKQVRRKRKLDSNSSGFLFVKGSVLKLFETKGQNEIKALTVNLEIRALLPK